MNHPAVNPEARRAPFASPKIPNSKGHVQTNSSNGTTRRRVHRVHIVSQWPQAKQTKTCSEVLTEFFRCDASRYLNIHFLINDAGATSGSACMHAATRYRTGGRSELVYRAVVSSVNTRRQAYRKYLNRNQFPIRSFYVVAGLVHGSRPRSRLDICTSVFIV